MTPLLEAAVAAREVGFDAPKCVRCTRLAVMGAEPREPAPFVCNHCYDTGLDASDPERLIGRAVVWIRAQRAEVEFRTCQWGDGRDTHAVNAWFLASTKVIDLEEHDGTPTGLATALLRLVARAGGAA